MTQKYLEIARRFAEEGVAAPPAALPTATTGSAKKANEAKKGRVGRLPPIAALTTEPLAPCRACGSAEDWYYGPDTDLAICGACAPQPADRSGNLAESEARVVDVIITNMPRPEVQVVRPIITSKPKPEVPVVKAIIEKVESRPLVVKAIIEKVKPKPLVVKAIIVRNP